MTLIKAEKISYTYPVASDDVAEGEATSAPADRAIEDVELTIEAGEFICILGRNGSGKSTLARHLNALLLPDEGTLWIDGMDSRDEGKVWDIRSLVGMVFQNPDNQIIGSMVDEDVAFGPENIGMPSVDIRREVRLALEKVDMSEYAKASPNRLSGGQKQRTAIAGILAMHPRCIVLDESTSMLDPRGRREVMSTVKELNRNHGITVICITHYMDEALPADRIFVMNEGSIIMEGMPKDIFSRPDELEKIGLRLPQISQLAWELKKAGLDIPAGITTRKELKAAVLSLKDKDNELREQGPRL
ncbi:MAG: energy-coupling factor transporter ATPase [Lachnospiraceae bacterium]